MPPYGQPAAGGPPSGGLTGPPPPSARPAAKPPKQRHPVRIILVILSVLLLLVLVWLVAVPAYAWSKVGRLDADPGGDRPANQPGQTFLLVGSDSREGLTAQERKRLGTGSTAGQRTDTIMIVYLPPGGRPALISVPRDSYLPIPQHGSNKINAAYSFGGRKLLAETVQNATGLRIDHYMEIGFGGLVNVVNAVGGVRICLPGPIQDPASGLDLKAGCQTLDGAEALGYVRTRHDFASQDLQRVQDQRIFLRALLRKMTSPGTLLNPFATVPAAFGATGALTVDKGTHLYQLLQVALALRNPQTTTVPIASAGFLTPSGESAVLWDTARAQRLFLDLNHDQPVPKSLLTGSHLAG